LSKDNPLKNAMSRAAAAGPAAGSVPSSTKPPSRRGKKGVLFHVDPEIAKRLKLLAVEQDTTIEALGVEALGLLFERYGQ
jgi:hypothetical protein